MFFEDPIRKKAEKIAKNHYDTWLPAAVEEDMTKRGIIPRDAPRNPFVRLYLEMRFSWELHKRYWALVDTIEDQLEREDARKNGKHRSEANPVL